MEPNGFKGQIVTFDRESCLLFKAELDKLLPPEATDIVMSVQAADKKEHPEYAPYDRSRDEEERLLDRFRDPADPLKLIIVTAKLLTGFDAPILQAMYLDKPLRDHTLLQAICRVNRTYSEQKTHGLIVDYLGIFDDVAAALEFDDQSVKQVISNIQELKDKLPEAMQKCLAFFPGIDRSQQGYEGLIAAQQCLQTMEQTVSMLVRGIGNRDGRSRSNVRLEERPVRLPRGLLVITAEMGLRGHSEQNRLLVVPLSRDDVNWKALTTTQDDGTQGRLAASMALFIQHLAGLKDFNAYKKRFEDYRSRAMACGLTGRAPEQVAYLAVGFAAYACHLKRQGVLTEPEAKQLAEEGFAVLRDSALAHRAQVQEVSPARRAIDAVREALATGLVHLQDKTTGGRPKGPHAFGWGEVYPKGEMLGWVDGIRDVVYLVPGAAYELIVKKTGITLTERALWRQWQAAGWLLEGDAGRNTVRGSFPRTGQLRVLPLRLDVLGKAMPKLVPASVAAATQSEEEIPQALLGLTATA